MTREVLVSLPSSPFPHSARAQFGFMLRGSKNGSGSQSPEFPPRSSHIIRQMRSEPPRSITWTGVDPSRTGLEVSSQESIWELGTSSTRAANKRDKLSTSLLAPVIGLKDLPLLKYLCQIIRKVTFSLRGQSF